MSSVFGARRNRSLEPALDGAEATITDVYLFGEAGLFGARRIAEDGTPALIKPGLHGAPRETGVVDFGRDPADPEGDTRPARADGSVRGLRAAAPAR